MVAILIYHTEMYYNTSYSTPYFMYTSNAITLFYFISGYLFYSSKPFYIKRKITSILKTMLLPYFIFTSAIAIPKAIVHGYDIDIINSIILIATGRASWFIAALIVAEIIFSILLWTAIKRKNWILPVFCLICLLTYCIMPPCNHNYWYWQDALLAVFFLYTGWIYHKYETQFNKINHISYFIIAILLAMIKVLEYDMNYAMKSISIINYPLFLADTLLCIFLFAGISKKLPSMPIIEWTGKHCIIYYFLAGGSPLITAITLNKLDFCCNNLLYRLLIASFISYCIATILTWVIYRYIPFVTGRKKNISG